MKIVTAHSGFLPFLLLLVVPQASSTEALVAVASNFSETVEELRTEFEAISEHRITIATGSTGKLYAQILNGAPFDILLAADEERPMLLEASGVAVEGTRFTYASGRLVLWSANPEMILSNLSATLAQEEIIALAIANPALAPYGIASREALQSLHIWDTVRKKIVMGENVGQTHALVATGNAQAGIVALSLVLDYDMSPDKTYLSVPEDLHAPIRQDAVLLRHGEGNSAATEFLAYLQSEPGQEVIRSNGYGVD